MPKPRSRDQSRIEMRELVMPHHANPQNTIFGGVIMSWVDLAASMCASRHSSRPVVTAQIDHIIFKSPVKVGHHVHIEAAVTYAGKTSMEVNITVSSENPLTGERRLTTTAFVTMVAVDEFGKPASIPSLDLTAVKDCSLYDEARKRVQERKKKRKV